MPYQRFLDDCRKGPNGTIPISELRRVARSLGINPNGLSKAELCAELEALFRSSIKIIPKPGYQAGGGCGMSNGVSGMSNGASGMSNGVSGMSNGASGMSNGASGDHSKKTATVPKEVKQILKQVNKDIQQLDGYCRGLAAVSDTDLKQEHYQPLLAELGQFIDTMVGTYDVPVSALSKEVSAASIKSNCQTLKTAIQEQRGGFLDRFY